MKTVLATAFLLFVSLSVTAQNAPALFSVREEVVRPSMAAQYEGASRDLMTLLAAQNADPKSMTIHTYMSADLHYLYVTPVANFAALDTMFSEWTKLGTAAGAKWADVMKRNGASVESWSDFMMTRRADLSYTPATPRVKLAEIRFVHLSYYYIDAAHVADAEQVAKEIAVLFQSKSSGESYSTYQVVTGQDLPLFIVADYAKSASDFYSAQERVMTAMPEIQPLLARAGATARRLEFRDVMFRPDLSYPLPAATK